MSTKGRRSERTVALFFFITAAVLLAYLPAIEGGPLWDDFGHITAPEFRSPAGLWRIWSELGATQQYYPLLHSAFWLEHRLWGDAFAGYHLANVAFHAASAFLVVLILRRLEISGALFAGLIFALHPTAAESVAWISEQKNTLSAMFYLASAYVYLGSAHYWLAFGLFSCALLTKTVTATLPAAILVVLWWKHGRLEWRDAKPLVPWFGVAAIAAIFTAWFERTIIGARGEDFALTLIERCLVAGRVVWFYLAKLFWPRDLIFIYPRWQIDAAVWWQYLFPAAAVALAIGLASLAHSSRGGQSPQSASGRRGPLAGYLYFVGTLVPALGFVDVYPFRFSYVADHFQYLASLGVIVPVAAALTAASAHWTTDRRLATMLGGAVVTVLAVLTWNRSSVYRDAETLYRDTIARNPAAWMAYQNLGTELAATNRFQEAIEAYEGALRARPDYAEAKLNLVLAHMKLADAAVDSPDRASSAITHYEAVLRLDPNHFRALYNLGTLLIDLPGRDADALRYLETAVKLQPTSVEARVNLGVLLADVPSRSREAVEHLEFALAKRPDLSKLRELVDEIRKKR